MTIPANSEKEALSRGDVEERLTEATVQRLFHQFEATTDFYIFRERLVHILYRYECGIFIGSSQPQKEVKKLLNRAARTASKLLNVLDEIDRKTHIELNSQIEFDSYREWQDQHADIFADRSISAPTTDEIEQSLKRLIHACQPETAGTDPRSETTAGDETDDQKPWNRTALDQLIVDINGTLRHHIGFSGIAGCYYDAVNDDYRGLLFEFTVILLDEYAPKSYFSRGALGKRIVRVLKKDR